MEFVGKNIATAMANIARDVDFVEKTGANSFQNYSYASELDLLIAVRPIMVDYGVTVFPQNIEMVSNAESPRTEAIVTYRFVHAESGEYVDVKVLSAGADKGDKGAFKLMTGALKYALRQSFLIATGDDPEAYEPSTGRRVDNNTSQEHPMQKIIKVAKNMGYDIVNDEPFASAWKNMKVNIQNLTTSQADMKFTVRVKDLVKALKNPDANVEKLVEDFVNAND